MTKSTTFVTFSGKIDLKTGKWSFKLIHIFIIQNKYLD
jgi:hypothetical protein